MQRNRLRGGFLKVVTIPSGVSIFVGEKPYGVSPAKIRMEQGRYIIALDHPHFNRIEEEVVIQNDEASDMNTIMVRAKRTIRVRVQPEGASVELAGKYLGLSPVETVVPTGEKLGLLISHQETESYLTNIEVGKGKDAYVIDVPPLIRKPSYVSINSIPQGADIYLNDRFIGKTPTGFFEGNGGDIKVVKKGYVDHIETIQLRGGERLTLPAINLVSLEKFVLEDSFYMGFIYAGKPKLKVNLNKFTSNGVDITDRLDGTSTNVNLQDSFGVSLEYTNFMGNKFFSVGFDIMNESKGVDRDGSSIQPISLFTNIGWAAPLSNQSYLKLFLGGGLSHLKYNNEDAKKLGNYLRKKSKYGPLFQLGIGFIQRRFIIDLMLRFMSGESTFNYDDVYYQDEGYNLKEEIDFSTFGLMLRIGTSF